MDDGCCAVCAEAVEWVAYGGCGHRDVCVTCIARLRFVCTDRRCCICKSDSHVVFVTKALGSFTRMINDFSILPTDAKDGKVGSFWFHEGIQAYFDDFDQYKIIKAMCRLSCSFCDKSEADGKRTSSKRGKFRSVEQLRDHLSRQHKLFFCSLCLEHKKVFICEQKLYNSVQLRRHISNGDSEVDGDERERCGFSGHPLCEFCQTPFYGDNELYFHMATEHYTCHICQRQHPIQYEYFQDYDHLENHFRQAHFLCEDDSCLEKKFIVFASEADMKRHNALEHGGYMSRSKRNAALQLPTCFRYREREAAHHVRQHISGLGASGHQLSSTTTARAPRTSSGLPHEASSSLPEVPGHSGTSETGSTLDSMPSIQVQGTELDFRSVLLSGSSFPPLPRTSKRRRRKSKKNSEETSTNTGVGCHLTPGTSAINGSSAASSVDNYTPSLSASGSSQSRVSSNVGFASHFNPVVLFQSRPLAVDHSTSSCCVLTQSSSGIISGRSANVGSSSAPPDLVDRGSIGSSACSECASNRGNVQTANKSLVEAIRAALEFDKDKFDIFKVISREYREGVIDAGEYLAHVQQFGLAHLIPDLARFCPDPQKQKELLEIHQTSLGKVKENGPRAESCKRKSRKGSEKGKEKCEDTGCSSRREALPNDIVNHLEVLKLEIKPDKETLSSTRVAYPAKGKCKAPTVGELRDRPSTELRSEDVGLSNGDGSKNSTSATGSKRKQKKNSKFLRTRLGESSAPAAPDLYCSDLVLDPRAGGPNQDSVLAAVHGVWHNGGGRRLVALSQTSSSPRRPSS